MPGRRGRRGRVFAVSGGRRGVEERSPRLRGESLVERFATDEELPAQFREYVRSKRERTMRARAAADVDIEEDKEEFVWMGINGWNGVKENFFPETSGPTHLVGNAYDAFRSYWDDALLSHIVGETNRYAEGLQSEKFRGSWYSTNMHEILILFAFWMMLDIIKMPTIKSCFSNSPVLRTEIFQVMFTEDRYRNLNRAFHLANGSQDANDPDNVLYRMGPVIENLNSKFQHNYRPHQDICIGEYLALCKDRVGFKYQIKTKSALYDLNTYELRESSTGYLWSFFIYTERQTTNSALPPSISTAINLVQPLLGLGHVVYVDRLLNSPVLARYLKRRKTDCVGTLRPSHKNVPAVVQWAPLADGQFVARQSGDMMIVAIQDRIRVTYVSTCHKVNQVQKEARPERPSQRTSKTMDEPMEPYLVGQKRRVDWTIILFKRLLNASIQNASILSNISTNSSIDYLAFRIALVQSILDTHSSHVPLKNPKAPPPPPCVSRAQFPIERLTERHFMRRIPITDEVSQAVRHTSKLVQRECVWCTANGRRGSKTAYECPQCKMPLCVEPCFKQFHTTP